MQSNSLSFIPLYQGKLFEKLILQMWWISRVDKEFEEKEVNLLKQRFIAVAKGKLTYKEAKLAFSDVICSSKKFKILTDIVHGHLFLWYFVGLNRKNSSKKSEFTLFLNSLFYAAISKKFLFEYGNKNFYFSLHNSNQLFSKEIFQVKPSPEPEPMVFEHWVLIDDKWKIKNWND